MKNKLITIVLINLAALLIIPIVVFAEESSMPGTIEGSGTYFEITDSEYLNISLQSTEEITIALESIPKTISLHIIEDSTLSGFSTLVIGGLEPDKTYYKFEDSYKNEAVLISDEDGSYSWVQDLTQPHHIWFQPENGTVFLPEDCSDYGNWDELTSTCTLTQDLTESIEITEDNVTLDGNGYKVIGNNEGIGVLCYNRTGITIKNLYVQKFNDGVYFSLSNNSVLEDSIISSNSDTGIFLFWGANNNVLKNNTSSDNLFGIRLFYNADNNTLENNIILSNEFGIGLEDASYSTLIGNNILDSHWFNFGIFGSLDSHFDHDIDTNNTIDNKPIYYIKNTSNQVYDNSTNASVFYCINCDNVTIKDLTFVNNGTGVFLWRTQNSRVENVTASDNADGVFLGFSSNNLITESNLSENDEGLQLFESSENLITDNDISNNEISFDVEESFDNKIYHNNFINNIYEPQVENGFGNLFDNSYPSGGNYWSDYAGQDQYSGPNQDEPGSDGIGDTPYVFEGGQDSYPFIEESGWEIPVNQPPTFSNSNQYKSDAQTEIPEGGITTESIVVFKATVTDPDNDQVKLQIELKEFNQPFDELGVLESELVSSGNEATITATNLIGGQYKWRARAVDSNEAASAWQEFGTTGNVDFKVQLPLSTKAAMLAKELINYSYLYGGKGWDYNESQFVAANTIKTGYTYWNQALATTTFGAGVDCSGLVMWSYDRSFDPLKSRFDNFVKLEGADDQYRYNTTSTTDSQLKPGDVMFFDNVPKDGFIDHVAMYIGESGGFDVVNAADIDRGIISASSTALKQLPKFVAFKQVVSASQPSILVSAHSPIDLIVTDPDGFTITPETIIPSDFEYLRQIPEVLYYSEMERGVDGNPIDQVYSYTVKTGNYLITVLPEPNALPTDTYALEVKTLINGEVITTVLAENVPISQIPEQPYLIKVTETGVIPATPMKSFTTKDMKINWFFDRRGYHWGSKTTFTISGSLELPDEYQKEDLDKSVFLNIQIADKLGKDKVTFKEFKNPWLYQEPRKWQKTDDSLNQGIDVKAAVINWTKEKKCKFFKWWCKARPQKNWFYIRGELSLEGIDVNTLPREATLILEIPMASNEETSSLAGIETIKFKKSHHTWFYHLSTKWKNWQDGWWKKWDNKGFNWSK